LGIPAVALAISITLLRSTTSGIQDSFYIVHLNSIGLTGTMIGILVSAAEISSGLGSLTAAKIERFLSPHWILIWFSLLAILFITVTPMISGFIALLFVFQGLRGLCQGVMQPVGFSILSEAAGPGAQGAVMGLRMTGTRFMNTILPPIMGITVEHWGIEAGFYLVGAVLSVILLLLALVIARSPLFSSKRENF
jgi:MFS family permease